MTASLEKLEQEILGLSGQERAFLADRLLGSLGSEPLSDSESAWLTEVDRRYAGFKTGARIPIPSGSVFADADKLLQ